MVVGERHRHTDEGPVPVRVRRTRSPQPRGRDAVEPAETPSDDQSGSSGDEDSGMRSGPEFQAVIPDCDGDCWQSDTRPKSSYATLVWSPNPDHLNARVDEYITIARKKHVYNMEQALGLLFWHKHNTDKALFDLANFKPFPEQWTTDDRVIFEQAFLTHGKNFNRIHITMPDKTISSLVKYYYSWKKSRCRPIIADKKTGLASDAGDEESTIAVESDSDFEAAAGCSTAKLDMSINRTATPSLPLTETAESAFSQSRSLAGGAQRIKTKPPRSIDVKDLMTFTSTMTVEMLKEGEPSLKQTEIELDALRIEIQKNRQTLHALKQRTHGIDALRQFSTPIAAINPMWTHTEILLAVQGLRYYGRNYEAIAEILTTKTPELVRNFYMNYQKTYRLDELVREYERDRVVALHKRHDIKLEEIVPPDLGTGWENGSRMILGTDYRLGSFSSEPPLLKRVAPASSGSKSQQPQHKKSRVNPADLAVASSSQQTQHYPLLQRNPLDRHASTVPQTSRQHQTHTYNVLKQ